MVCVFSMGSKTLNEHRFVSRHKSRSLFKPEQTDSGEMKYLIFTVLVVSHKRVFVLTNHMKSSGGKTKGCIDLRFSHLRYTAISLCLKGSFTDPCAVVCKRCLFTLGTHFCLYWDRRIFLYCYYYIIIIDRFYIALFSALEQTHCARM